MVIIHRDKLHAVAVGSIGISKTVNGYGGVACGADARVLVHVPIQ